MDILECGKVFNTHGVRGEIKVENYCDEGFFKKIKKITVGGTEYKIKAARDHGAFILLTLEGIENIDQAILLKNKAITIPRAELKLKKGEYLYQDLFGFDVYDLRSDTVIGRLKDVLERPASMVYVIDCDGTEALIPAVEPFHQGVDLEKRVLTLRTIEGMLPHEN